MLSLALVAACNSRPIDRPLDGATGDTVGRTFREDSGPPTIVLPDRATPRPTLPGSVRELTPGVTPTAASKPPQIKRLDPLPDAQVFAGNVRFMLQVSSTANLAAVTALLDGQAVRPVVSERSPRLWAVSFIGNLAPGSHEVNVEARDADGQLGTLLWQFEVVPGLGQVATPATAPPGPPDAGTPVPSSTPEESAPQGDATAAPPEEATAVPAEPTVAPQVGDSPTPSEPTPPPAESTPEAAPSPEEPPPPEGEQPTVAPAEQPPEEPGAEPTPERRKPKPTDDSSNEQDNQG